MKKTFFFFIIFFLNQISFAQTIQVTGSVKNEMGFGIPYAIIQNNQDHSAIYTDSLGKFNLLTAPNSILIISSNGYKNAFINIDKRNNLQVVLKVGVNKPNNDNPRSNSDIDNRVADAFSGHSNEVNTYNSNGMDVKFNGASFPIVREKEETHGSRYFITDWVKGTVVNAQGQQINNTDFHFKYDKISGNLLLTYDEKSAIEVDKSQIRSFTLKDKDNNHYFFEIIPAIDKIHFVQVLSAGNKYEIYKLIKTKLIGSSYTTNGLTSAGNPYDEFVDEYTYYISSVKSKEVQKFSLKKRSIKEAFEKDEDKVDGFFNKYGSNKIDDQYLINLASFLNN